MDAETDRRKSGVYKYRASTTSEPVSAGDAIRQVVNSLGMAEKLKQQRVLSLWEEIVGKDIASVTRVEGFRGGQLLVSVQNPTWRHWLIFQREAIRQNLNREVGGEVVKTIRLQ
jgi:predicted nucleic acid-binding Zn ribbon protein